jgi:hypothetical protein
MERNTFYEKVNAEALNRIGSAEFNVDNPVSCGAKDYLETLAKVLDDDVLLVDLVQEMYVTIGWPDGMGFGMSDLDYREGEYTAHFAMVDILAEMGVPFGDPNVITRGTLAMTGFRDYDDYLYQMESDRKLEELFGE